MKFLAIAILFASLTGCATWEPVKPETKIVIQQEYIVRIPPVESLTIPPAVKDIDVDTATQGEIAKWLVDYEKRMDTLEGMIREIAKFLKDEQDKANKVK